MMNKITSLFRSYEEELPLIQLIGPLSILFTVVLAARIGGGANYDLALIGAVGLVLSAKWEVRGCVYALILLVCSSFIKHLFFIDSHAVQLGLEASVGFALLISAMTFQEGSLFFASMNQKIEAKDLTIQNLEEEIEQHKEDSSKELIAASEKIASLSQSIEEIESESSALHVLNEVLRKSTAQAIDEKETFSSLALQAERKAVQLLLEVDALQKELNRLGVESTLVQQNRELFQEINAVRYKEEQTHLINETLVRLHAKECQKAKELEGRVSELTLEKEKSQEQLSFARREAQMSATQLEQLAGQLQTLGESQHAYDAVQTERTFLRERLTQAEAELQQKSEKAEQLEARLNELHGQLDSTATLSKTEAATLVSEKTHLLAQLDELRAHLSQHAQSEALYRQLRGQFEERNQVLHETRKQLFRADTQLQTLKAEMEQKNLESDPLPTPVRLELDTLEEENQRLAEENRLLQDLVTHFIEPTNLIAALPIPAPAVKKKDEESASP